MAKRIPVELQMTELTRTASAGKSPAVIDALRAALCGKSNLLAARAAALVEEHGVGELAAELSAAFDRFMVDPVSTDKGCVAKNAIAKALYSLGAGEAELFIRGVRHRQLEAGWGKPTDVAGELRATSCLALVRVGYRDVMWEIAALFADDDPLCRVTAARAVAYSERDDGLALLRLRILAGDEDDVIAECFTAMVRLSPVKGIPFVADYLEAGEETRREAAALALGASRRPEAFTLLKERWEQWIDPTSRRLLLLAMATLRLEPAFELVLNVIRDARPGPAKDAINAMAIYRRDEVIRSRVAKLVEGREEEEVRKEFAEKF